MTTNVERDMAAAQIFHHPEPTFDATCRLQIEKYKTAIARLETDERSLVFEIGQREKDLQKIRDDRAEAQRGLVAARAALSRFYDEEE